MELQRERSRKQESDTDEEKETDDMSPAKRCSVEWSSEGDALSNLLCKAEDDSVLTGEENLDPELISGVMRSLADEIMCNKVPSASESASIFSSNGNSNNTSTTLVDIEYLLVATDEELGIPPSPKADDEIIDVNGAIPENPMADLINNLRPESEGEGLFKVCNSVCWYSLEEQNVAFLNDAHSQGLLERALNGDIFYELTASPADQTLMPSLEAGAAMEGQPFFV